MPNLLTMSTPIQETDTSCYHESPTSAHFLVITETPDHANDQMSNANSTTALVSPLDAAPPATLHEVVSAYFCCFGETLQVQISEEKPRPLCSYIGQLISRLTYKKAGVERFA